MPKFISPRVKQAQIAWIFIIIGYILVTYLTLNHKHQGKGKYSEQNWNNLRKTHTFSWYTVPLLVIVMNIYFDEIRNRNWSAVFAGLAFLFMDVFNEVWNGILYQLTGQFAGLWMINRPTAYQVTVGWNIEIIYTFLIAGIMSTKLLSKNKEATWLGINNRQVAAIGLSLLSVIVETGLNYFDALIWNYPFWNHNRPFFIFLNGYFPFFQLAYYIYDLEDFKKQSKFVAIFGTAMTGVMGYLMKIKYI